MNHRFGIELRPIVTEKAVMKIELENVLTFSTGREVTKEEIKKEVEKVFQVKIEKIRTMVKQNKKFAYIKLKNKFPAIDVATKLGLM